jgi:hypothetical protein
MGVKDLVGIDCFGSFITTLPHYDALLCYTLKYWEICVGKIHY